MKKGITFYLGPAIIILTLGAAVAFLVPAYNNFQRLEAELRVRERQIEREKENSAFIKETHNKLLEYRPEITKIENAFPKSDIVISEFHNFIRRETAQGGLILRGVGIGTTVEVGRGSDLMRTGFSISATTSYSALKSFLSALYRNARLVSVDSVSMGAPDEAGFFEVTLEMSTYSYK